MWIKTTRGTWSSGPKDRNRPTTVHGEAGNGQDGKSSGASPENTTASVHGHPPSYNNRQSVIIPQGARKSTPPWGLPDAAERCRLPRAFVGEPRFLGPEAPLPCFPMSSSCGKGSPNAPASTRIYQYLPRTWSTEFAVVSRSG